ncbi:hypothetical protein PBI_LAUER_54 [Gordonia phage Lauer]|uniref:Uncharacterized protein n=4 Tax=Ponsvirus TaxID=3044795 RepID=A0A516KU74_9CAUD|nr:hypothetical protein PP993_gp63 [Gordonia phage Mayweather]YP_010663195.1 hypothetical protein PP994_gp60 [Gordonia phage CherryonLim]YP_010663261.1 hypothetical protein PP995_gp54 [Gordonia phage Lauer]YP_010663336.1 hypothetical protein PP996_gp63 [Gordonia phage SheckWes]QDM56489.1 hypothetical protein SEA_SHECKWES_63 [Gordonia phage SheckWes]QDP45224.1 hypothetical protein SEA_MAYWEATHER_63 [Gordonia phage Mayweather]QFP95813.1 hypothetical protein SEA_CHERRYONLIM_60 [Gordonia phage Ch
MSDYEGEGRDTVTLPADELTAFLLALKSIVDDSHDADVVKIAMIALYETQAGRTFLATNPIEVN